MNRVKLTLLAASLLLALAFTFSCSDDSDDGSSNASEIITIGGRTWMKHNLNTNVPGSKCYGEGGQVYDSDTEDYVTLTDSEIQANCAKYGRLYDWATAMALDASCNSVSCADQIDNPHRGICPQGWHIPSEADWDALMTAVGGISTAGTKLKSTTGWSDCGPSGSGSSYLCEDTYGFSALCRAAVVTRMAVSPLSAEEAGGGVPLSGISLRTVSTPLGVRSYTTTSAM